MSKCRLLRRIVITANHQHDIYNVKKGLGLVRQRGHTKLNFYPKTFFFFGNQTILNLKHKYCLSTNLSVGLDRLFI